MQATSSQILKKVNKAARERNGHNNRGRSSLNSSVHNEKPQAYVHSVSNTNSTAQKVLYLHTHSISNLCTQLHASVLGAGFDWLAVERVEKALLHRLRNGTWPRFGEENILYIPRSGFPAGALQLGGQLSGHDLAELRHEGVQLGGFVAIRARVSRSGEIVAHDRSH